MRDKRIKRIIYGLICPISKQIRYIGQTKSKSANERLGDHIRESFYEQKYYTHKQRWIRKVHSDITPITCIILDEAKDDFELDEKERDWIAKLPSLTNSLSGGSSGYSFSPEVKERMSKSKQGYKNPNFGNHSSPSVKQSMARAEGMKNSEKFQKSRKSQQYRKKISDIQSVNCWLVLDSFGVIIAQFRNAKEVTKYFSKLLGKLMTSGNIKNARRFRRPVGKQLTSWFYICYEQDLAMMRQKIEYNKIINK